MIWISRVHFNYSKYILVLTVFGHYVHTWHQCFTCTSDHLSFLGIKQRSGGELNSTFVEFHQRIIFRQVSLSINQIVKVKTMCTEELFLRSHLLF